jgi:hypothetical protein
VNENPFLSDHIKLAHTNTLSRFLIGLQASPEKRIGARAQLSYALVKNMAFFVNNAQRENFDIFYENRTTGVFEATGAASLHWHNLKSQFEVSYFKYNLPTLPQAWHKPTTSAHWMTTYTLAPNWRFSSDLYVMGGIKGKNPTSGGVVSLPTILDLNMKGEYMFENNFSVFLEMNNMLSKNYQRYLYYKVKGVNFLVGAAFKF